MAHLVSKIEALLLEEPLDSLCGALAVYLVIENNILPSFDYVRGVIDRAVNSSLLKIETIERKTKVLEMLSQVGKNSDSVVSIFNDESMAFKALNVGKESYPDRSREEIYENINKLKYKLEARLYIQHTASEADASLYGALRQTLENVDLSNLTWRDLEASMVISDDSFMVKNLGRRQKSTFLEPQENMKCTIPESVTTKCNEFISNINNSNTLWVIRNISHDKRWKEDESSIIKITERILGTLLSNFLIWNNPAFVTSTSRSEQSEDDTGETKQVNIFVPKEQSSVNIDTSCGTNSESNPKQDSGHDNTFTPDISINDSNSDEHQEETLSQSLTENSPKEDTYMSNNRVSAKAHIKSSISLEQKKEQGLIQEISTSIKDQSQATKISANNSPKMFAKNHVTKNLIQESSGKDDVILFSASKSKVLLNLTHLYKKACDAEKQAIKVNQDEITCWYYYIIEFDNQVKNLMKSDHIGEKKAKGQIYDFIIAQLNTKRKMLQKQNQKARKIYNLFEKIKIDKIQHIKTFSTDAISRFTNSQIQTIIDHFAKKPDIEYTDDQDDSDDLPKTEVSIHTEKTKSRVSDSSIPLDPEGHCSAIDFQENNQVETKARNSVFSKLPDTEVSISQVNTSNHLVSTSDNNSRPPISILPNDPEEKQKSVINKVLE
ncbi:10796_t:CDS:2 [Ambispora gerdemannii]|uniref:10796_t:CDS:1 n=1 Tax=Ambispora gerdemannii TaxID=144530 RepID=A0A9N9G1C7_9GLOM|nr:10796_t:CDS:2 [Ambispora gerdemannii]